MTRKTDFPREQGSREFASARAIKRMLASELRQAMTEARISQAELARRMRTSRAVVHRLLDETDLSVTLATISKVATALGRSVQLQLSA